MAIARITEYTEWAKDGHIPINGVPQVPGPAKQKVTFTTTTQSAAFNARTKFIRVRSDTLCYIEVGANPTAITDTGEVLAANTDYWLGVNPGDKIAFVT